MFSIDLQEYLSINQVADLPNPRSPFLTSDLKVTVPDPAKSVKYFNLIIVFPSCLCNQISTPNAPDHRLISQYNHIHAVITTSLSRGMGRGETTKVVRNEPFPNGRSLFPSNFNKTNS